MSTKNNNQTPQNTSVKESNIRNKSMNKKRIKGKQQKKTSSRRARAGASKATKMKPLKLTPEQTSEIVECVKFVHAKPEELTREQAQFKKSFEERIKIYEDRLKAEGNLNAGRERGGQAAVLIRPT